MVRAVTVSYDGISAGTMICRPDKLEPSFRSINEKAFCDRTDLTHPETVRVVLIYSVGWVLIVRIRKRETGVVAVETDADVAGVVEAEAEAEAEVEVEVEVADTIGRIYFGLFLGNGNNGSFGRVSRDIRGDGIGRAVTGAKANIVEMGKIGKWQQMKLTAHGKL